MTVKQLIRRARELYNCGVPHIDKHNRAAWVRSILYLGDKWLLARKAQRRAKAQ